HYKIWLRRILVHLLGPSSRIYPTLAVAGVGASYGTRSFLRPTEYAESPKSPQIFNDVGCTTLCLRDVKGVNHHTNPVNCSHTRGSRGHGSPPCVSTHPSPIRAFRAWISSHFMKNILTKEPSTHLHSLSPGDTLTFAAIIKKFPWTLKRYLQVYLIAGGAGITAIYQPIQALRSNPNDQTESNLVVGVKTEQDLLLRDELRQYQKQSPSYFHLEVSQREKGRLCRRVTLPRSFCERSLKVRIRIPMPFVWGHSGSGDALVGSRRSSAVFRAFGILQGTDLQLLVSSVTIDVVTILDISMHFASKGHPRLA
ncbi:NADH-cytochrome b5 reductase 2, partial [Penicillium rolfsii]